MRTSSIPAKVSVFLNDGTEVPLSLEETRQRQSFREGYQWALRHQKHGQLRGAGSIGWHTAAQLRLPPHFTERMVRLALRKPTDRFKDLEPEEVRTRRTEIEGKISAAEKRLRAEETRLTALQESCPHKNTHDAPTNPVFKVCDDCGKFPF